MSESFKERIGVGQPCHAFRRAGGPGTTKTTRVPREDSPGVAGTTTEHWDGRRDAKAVVQPVRLNKEIP